MRGVAETVDSLSASTRINAAVVRHRVADHLSLAKPRLSFMVLLSALVGFWLASPSQVDVIKLLWFAIGTFLVVAGANAFNQVLERSEDALMQRTADRPIPAGRLSVGPALGTATLFAVIGITLLLLFSNWATALLSVAALFIYVGIYTSLKRRSVWSTFAGALSGAIPPLMGWCAVEGHLPLEAWSLFGMLFFWQFPHTWAIAVNHREDYERVGYPILPLIDSSGWATRVQTVLASIALLGVSLLPTFLGTTGWVYFTGALVLGTFFVISSARFGDGRERKRAGELLMASLIYLPLVLVLLTLDRRLV